MVGGAGDVVGGAGDVVGGVGDAVGGAGDVVGGVELTCVEVVLVPLGGPLFTTLESLPHAPSSSAKLMGASSCKRRTVEWYATNIEPAEDLPSRELLRRYMPSPENLGQ